MATNKEIVESAHASFAAGDVPAALGAMADDIQWTEADGFPLAGTYVGHQVRRAGRREDGPCVDHERWQSCRLPAARRHPQGSRTQLTHRAAAAT